MNVFGLLGIIYISTFILGHFLGKMRIPWIFAALLLGVAFSNFNPFTSLTNSPEIHFMSNVGLYLLLFLIGYELSVKEILKSGKFIVKATFAIELTEMIFVGTALHYIFALPWPIALIVALSFATVGEAILLPILDELKLVKTRLGQLTLGIATFDDIFEVLVLLGIVIILPNLVSQSAGNHIADPMLTFSLYVLIWLIVFAMLFFRPLKYVLKHMQLKEPMVFIPIVFGFLCLCIGIDTSRSGDIAVLGALFAGIFTKIILSSHEVESLEPYIKALTYGLFGPVFLFTVGLDTNLNYILDSFWIVLLIATLAPLAKILVSYLLGKHVIGVHNSIFMGVALSVRFSTSLVFLKVLLDNQIISNDIYSILIGTSIIYKFIIPVLLSTMAKKWHL